jgi:7,8-dihydropterin-6-yl-methyl-4-(beta-D-ribofuranosyl)aminobenzene 5'-phosphate synthase
VDSFEVTILVDNFIDVFMESSGIAKRYFPPPDFFDKDRQHLIAEHGYSLALTVSKEGRRTSILYDAGLGRDTVTHNMDILQVRPEELRAVVLSHGHADHHGGLEGLLKRVGPGRMPLVLHPDVWLQRRLIFPTGAEIKLPPPSYNDLDREGVEIIEERGPSLLLDGTVLVTGQVARTTDFEPGLPPQQAFINGKWLKDTWTWDDQAIVVNLKDKGLVVLSSCSHSGVINILQHARNITGIEKIYAFAGGMHLTGFMEPVIPRTLDELKVIAPEIIVPGHCTGWKATHRLSQLFAPAFLPGSVGTRLQFA